MNNIIVSQVMVNPNKSNELTAQLKHTVKSDYTITNSLFSAEELGRNTFDNTRVILTPVPMGTTKEALQAHLDKNFPNAKLYRVLSYSPILTKEDNFAIANDSTTVEALSAKQVVRNNANEIVLHNGKVQYRRCFLSADGTHPDVDNRITKTLPIEATITTTTTTTQEKPVEVSPF